MSKWTLNFFFFFCKIGLKKIVPTLRHKELAFFSILKRLMGRFRPKVFDQYITCFPYYNINNLLFWCFCIVDHFSLHSSLLLVPPSLDTLALSDSDLDSDCWLKLLLLWLNELMLWVKGLELLLGVSSSLRVDFRRLRVPGREPFDLDCFRSAGEELEFWSEMKSKEFLLLKLEYLKKLNLHLYEWHACVRHSLYV